MCRKNMKLSDIKFHLVAWSTGVFFLSGKASQICCEIFLAAFMCACSPKLLAPMGQVFCIPRELKRLSFLCLCCHFIVKDETKNLISTLTESNSFDQPKMEKNASQLAGPLPRLQKKLLHKNWFRWFCKVQNRVSTKVNESKSSPEERWVCYSKQKTGGLGL